MEERQARLVVLIDPKNKAAFEAMCASRELTSSEVVRQLILEYLARHGVNFHPGGSDARPASAE